MAPSLRVAVTQEKSTVRRTRNMSSAGDPSTCVDNEEEGAAAAVGEGTGAVVGPAVTSGAEGAAPTELPVSPNAGGAGTDIELSRVQNRYARAWNGGGSGEVGVGGAGGANTGAVTGAGTGVGAGDGAEGGGGGNGEGPTLIKLQDFVNARATMSDSTLYCVVCNMKANSQEHLETHMAGKPHKRRKTMYEHDVRLEKKYGNSLITRKVSLGKWKCIPCNTEMGSDAVDAHLDGRGHRNALKRFQPDTGTPNGSSSSASRSNRSAPSPMRSGHGASGAPGGAIAGATQNGNSCKNVPRHPTYTASNQPRYMPTSTPAREPLLAYPNAQPGFVSEQYNHPHHHHTNTAVPIPAPNPDASNSHGVLSVCVPRKGTNANTGGGCGGVGMAPQIDVVPPRHVPPRVVEPSPAYQGSLGGLNGNNPSIVSHLPQPPPPPAAETQTQALPTTGHHQPQIGAAGPTAYTRLNANAKEFQPLSPVPAPLPQRTHVGHTNMVHQVAVGSTAFALSNECGIEILPAQNASAGHSRVRQLDRATTATEANGLPTHSLNASTVRHATQANEPAPPAPPARQSSGITQPIKPGVVPTRRGQLSCVAESVVVAVKMPQRTQIIIPGLQGGISARTGVGFEMNTAASAVPGGGEGGGVVVEMPPRHAMARAPEDYMSANPLPVEVEMPAPARIEAAGSGSGSESVRSTQRSAPASLGRGRPLKKKKPEKEKEEELYYCRICDIRCSSEGNLQEHMRSSKHLRKIGVCVPANDGGNAQRNEERKCEVCDVIVFGDKNWLSHVKGAKHTKKASTAARCTPALTATTPGANNQQ